MQLHEPDPELKHENAVIIKSLDDRWLSHEITKLKVCCASMDAKNAHWSTLPKSCFYYNTIYASLSQVGRSRRKLEVLLSSGIRKWHHLRWLCWHWTRLKWIFLLAVAQVHRCEMHFSSHMTQCLAGLWGTIRELSAICAWIKWVSQCNKERSSHSFCHEEVIQSDRLNQHHHLQENGTGGYTLYRGVEVKVKTNLICHMISQFMSVTSWRLPRKNPAQCQSNVYLPNRIDVH